jgi:hypothetical protein
MSIVTGLVRRIEADTPRLQRRLPRVEGGESDQTRPAARACGLGADSAVGPLLLPNPKVLGMNRGRR